MNVLSIGNSFSQNATRYLYDIARADGVSLNVANLYIGGCSLERHYRNMLSDERAYSLEYNGHKTGFFVSLKEALLNRRWDVITVQQASHFSFDFESYEPYLSEITEFVRKCAPKARIYVHQTWAYEEGSERLAKVAGYERAEAMFEDIFRAYDLAAEKISADGIIPSGRLFKALLDEGAEGLYHDTFHASRGLGRYALGLLWYSVLCGADVLENTFCELDVPVTENELMLVKKCVTAVGKINEK